MKDELDFSNYATKADLKNATVVDTSKFAKKVDKSKFAKKVVLASLKSHVDKLEKVPTVLNSLKSKVDKLDVDKLVPVLVDLNELGDVF